MQLVTSCVDNGISAGLTAGTTQTFSAVAGAANAATTVLFDTRANLNGANLANVRLAYVTDEKAFVFDANGDFTAADDVTFAKTGAALAIGDMVAANVVIA